MCMCYLLFVCTGRLKFTDNYHFHRKMHTISYVLFFATWPLQKYAGADLFCPLKFWGRSSAYFFSLKCTLGIVVPNPDARFLVPAPPLETPVYLNLSHSKNMGWKKNRSLPRVVRASTPNVGVGSSNLQIFKWQITKSESEFWGVGVPQIFKLRVTNSVW